MPPEDEREETDEEPYVKVDRRASRGMEEDPADGEPVSGEPTPPVEEPADERPDINVYSLLRMSLGMYIEQAWIHMGIRMDPSRNRVEQNLPYAKVAIDTVAFMLEQLRPDLEEAEQRELDLALANLRMNFIRRT